MRECGECGECCFAMGIKELNKPAMKQCEHFCGGCSIYESRPKTCSDWNCLWILGRLPKGQRPDKTHIVFYLPSADESARWGGRLVMASESRGSAHRMPHASKVIRKLFRDGSNVMIINADGGRTLHLHRVYLARVIVESKKKAIVPKVNGSVASFTPEQAEVLWGKAKKAEDS